MSYTDGTWASGYPYTDQEIFVGASEFKELTSTSTLGSSAAGFFSHNLASTIAGNFFANITAMLKRTGALATPDSAQRQYGTAASQPGPSSVPGTTGPLALQGRPPVPSAKLATLVGPVSGPLQAGVSVTSVDILYQISTVNSSLSQVGLTETNFVDNVAPNVIQKITLGANGLATAFRAGMYRTNVPVVSPAYPILQDTESILQVKFTAGSGGTIVFFGAVLKCSVVG